MAQSPKQNLRSTRQTTAPHQGAVSGPSTKMGIRPRATSRVQRRDGELTVKEGLESFRIAELCPSRLARAIHRCLLPLMDAHPATFPPLTMCTRTTRADMTIAISYGTDRHIVPLETARDYLMRLVGGYTGRHDAQEV